MVLQADGRLRTIGRIMGGASSRLPYTFEHVSMANTRGFGRLGKAWVQESAQKNRHLVESLVDVSQPRDIDSVRGRFGALLPEAETGAETRAGCLYPSRPHCHCKECTNAKRKSGRSTIQVIYRHNHFLLNITCRKTKDATEFGMDRNQKPDGLRLSCKECTNAKNLVKNKHHLEL